jgi:phosphatidylglycerol---prolipoprotein diacylglyceryl transferase
MNLDFNLHIAYSLMVLTGIALFVFFRPASQYSSGDKQSYYRLQAITLIAAVLGAKFAVLMGDALWPIKPFHGWLDLLTSGRSIAGALLFGFLAAEIFKPILGYKLPPNDRFAIVLPFSIATGRLGCWLSGCCLGIPMQGPFSLIGLDGVPRFPAPLVEMSFHLMTGIGLVLLWRRKILVGRLFAVYLLTYGLFRFCTEFLRVTEKAFYGYSAYQWFALAMILASAASLYLRREPIYIKSKSSTVLP